MEAFLEEPVTEETSPIVEKKILAIPALSR